MTVLKSIVSFQANARAMGLLDELEEAEVPETVETMPVDRLAQILTAGCSEETEDFQEQSNKDRAAMLEKISDPKEATNLVATWLLDRRQAMVKTEEYQAWNSQPETARQGQEFGDRPAGQR